MKTIFQSTLKSTLFISTLCLSSHSFSSGFALIENSASGMGQAFAGSSAVAEDSSTIFFNPAGMTYLKGTQVTTGLHIISSDAEFNDKGSTQKILTGSDEGGNAGDTFVVPNFYYVQDFGHQYKIGLGINAPFGLGTEYKKSWMGRYTSTKSEVKSVNINPAFSYKANDKLSLGIGANAQYFETTLKSDINQTLLGQSDAHSKMHGDSWAWGYNAGFIYQYTPATRLGMHYRSKISHKLKGKVKYKNISPLLRYNPNPMVSGRFNEQDIDADIDTPSTVSLSMTHQFNQKLTLLGDITYTEWSNFDQLLVKGDYVPVITQVEENWDDVYRYSLGMKYQYNPHLILRTGVAYDETPIDDKYRTSRIPGDDRTWLSFGASYIFNKNLSIDVGYSHLWVEDADINEEFNIANGESGALIGDFDSSVDILSIQATWKF
ncbi:MAG: outer membrane protein transport protein [Gammaproteobacteria bacterium]|nr:outer membrane protein transport protein [Gammaproteobacteria bacterium]